MKTVKLSMHVEDFPINSKTVLSSTTYIIRYTVNRSYIMCTSIFFYTLILYLLVQYFGRYCCCRDARKSDVTFQTGTAGTTRVFYRTSCIFVYVSTCSICLEDYSIAFAQRVTSLSLPTSPPQLCRLKYSTPTHSKFNILLILKI